MPTIPPMDIPGPIVDAEDFYRVGQGGGLYDPMGTQNKSLESLNGLLDKGNFKSAFKVEPWMAQVGTFARGAYWGSDRWEFTYTSQMSRDVATSHNDVVGVNRIILTQLSRTLFIPWKPSIILWGFQGWFRQDATKWDTIQTEGNISTTIESWDLQVKINNAELTSHRVLLPYGRGTTARPQMSTNFWGSSGPQTTTDPGEQYEDRYRFVEKSGQSGLSEAGFFSLEVSLGSNHFEQFKGSATIDVPGATASTYWNLQDPKVSTANCAAWVLALR